MFLNNKAFLIRKKKKGNFMKYTWTYEIFDPETNEQIGAVKDEPKGLLRFVGGALRKGLIPRNLNIYDCADESKIFNIKIAALSSKMSITDQQGRLVAQLSSKLLGGCFYTASEIDGTEIGQIKGHVMSREFYLVSPHNKQMGIITKSWENSDGTFSYASPLEFVIVAEDTGAYQPDVIKMILVAAGLGLDSALSKR